MYVRAAMVVLMGSVVGALVQIVRGFGGSDELSRWSTRFGWVAAVAYAIMAVYALPR